MADQPTAAEAAAMLQELACRFDELMQEYLPEPPVKPLHPGSGLLSTTALGIQSRHNI